MEGRISTLLRKGANAASRDTSIFSSWQMHEISTLTALEMFKKSNKIKEDISEEEFVGWLNSIGWVRYE